MGTSSEIVDVCVGKNLKAYRKMRGLSQGKLANALGITFQQVQKYEQGINRISASRLYDISKVLKIDIHKLYAGLPESHVNNGSLSDGHGYFSYPETVLHNLSSETYEMIRLFESVNDMQMRKSLLNMMRAYCGDLSHDVSVGGKG